MSTNLLVVKSLFSNSIWYCNRQM